MKKAYMLIGCPGSGKTKWALEKGLGILSRDQIRVELGMCKEGEKYLGSREEEDLVTTVFYRYLKHIPGDIILDNTNASPYFRKTQILRLKKLGFYVIGVRMKTPLDICLERKREQIPEEAIKKIYQKTQKIDPSEFDEFLEV